MSFNITPFNDRVLRVYVSSGHSTREQLVRGKINVRKMKTKLYLETLWTMGSRIYGEGTIQIPQSSSATIDPLAL